MSKGRDRLKPSVVRLGVALALVAFPGAAQAATIPVEITADEIDADADCSLREAVESINDGMAHAGCADTSMDGFGTNDTVTVPAGDYDLTITGTNEDANVNGDLDIFRDLTITGTGNPTIDQMVADERVLDVPAVGVDLTLNGLTVTGGSLTGASIIGGNVRHQGDNLDQLTLSNVDVLNGVADNPATGGAGGGIYSTSPVSILNGSLIMDNEAGGSAGTSGSGGGIFMATTATSLTVTNSEISSNDAGFGGGLGTVGGGGGIGFQASGAATINLTNATIDSNRAGGSGGTSGGSGGGVDVQFTGATTLTVTGGSISNNEAGGGSASTATGFGGGLRFAPGPGGSASLDGVQVTGNKAGGNGGTATGFGGGIFLAEDLTIDDSSINGNTAGINASGTGGDGNGGGIATDFNAPADVTITDSTISLNQAGENTANGGGIQMEAAGNLSISDSTISGNTAGATVSSAGAFGGGVSRFASMGSPNDLIQRTTISGNSTAGAGFDAPHGGGLGAFSQGTLTIDASTISGNAAIGNNGTVAGGGLMLVSSSTTSGTYAVTNSTVSGNSATSPSGNGGNGGGIATGLPLVGNPPAPQVTITHSTIANNSADPDGAGGLGGNLFSARPGTDLVDLRASILANGQGDPGLENCASEDSTMFQSLSENVETTTPTQCELNAITGDQIGVDPLLAALSPANGGDPANGIPTATRALMAGSPAINSVNLGCPPPATDQRGVARPQLVGGFCDAGAYEVPDTDSDGILDTSDNCPTQAGPASNGGCPLPVVTPPVTSPPPATPTAPTTPAKKKKCKKGRKLKKGKCVKKKRKKR